MTVSANYKKIEPADWDAFDRVFADAWQEPHLPARQYQACVKDELEGYRTGRANSPFDCFINLLKFIPAGPKTLLDVGASSAYYSEVLSIRGFGAEYAYTAVDFSTYYKDLAGQLFPGIKFEIGSALELPFPANSFDVVLHGACIMHLRRYERAIAEAVRVAKHWVIFHRTPIYLDDTPTEGFVKTAYGVPC